MVGGALSIHVDNREEYANKNMDLKMFYSTAQDFESIAAKIGVMNELKAGVPRGAYGGVVSFWWKSNRMFIVPQSGPMNPITYLNEPPYRIG
jgi:alpha-1,3-mannosyl-glycoprotein beta-1,2-N-acetylglucosaminyltransferase